MPYIAVQRKETWHKQNDKWTRIFETRSLYRIKLSKKDQLLLNSVVLLPQAVTVLFVMVSRKKIIVG